MSANDTIDWLNDSFTLIAAEYVLGVLGAAERREVEQRLTREPALASEVVFWEERLTGLTDAVAPLLPPKDTWSRIETAIGARQREQTRQGQRDRNWQTTTGQRPQGQPAEERGGREGQVGERGGTEERGGGNATLTSEQRTRIRQTVLEGRGVPPSRKGLSRETLNELGKALEAYFDDLRSQGVPDRFKALLQRYDDRKEEDKARQDRD
jgi:hypothetical protein